MKKQETNLKRRFFLLSAGAGGAAATAAVVGSVAPQVVKETVVPEMKQAAEAGVSEHMKNYYRTARI